MKKLIVLSVLLLSTSPIEASSKDNALKYMRSKVTQEEIYEFGTEKKYSIQEDQTILLKCTSNTDGIEEVLICLTEHFAGHRSIYIYCVRKQEDNLGGWPPERIDGTFRAIERCAVVAEWEKEKDGLELKFILTDDRKCLTQKFKEFWKQGRFANSGHWEHVVDIDELKLNADERIEIFVRLWTKIKYNFANFDLVSEVNWDQVLEDQLPLVRQDQSNEDFSKLLVRCVAGLKDGHTDVRMKFFEIFDQAQPALKIESIENKAIITQVGSSKDIVKADLKVGDEILKIDGRDVKDILEKDIYPYIFASTDQSRNRKAFRYLLRGENNSKIQLRVKTTEGKQNNITLTRISDYGKSMPRKDYTNVEYQELENGISYIAINTFGTSEVVDKFREHMDSICKSGGLIIDVRKNGGGNSGYGNRIVSFLIGQPILDSPWKTPQHIAAFEAWGRPKDWYVGAVEYVEPSQEIERYSGPVVVLTGAETGSAAEDFLVLLHSSERATLVGGKTDGSTGQPLRFEFDYGVTGRICTKRNTYPDGREFVGVGVIPDVEVYPTPEDIAAGKDTVLQEGIKQIKLLIEKEN